MAALQRRAAPRQADPLPLARGAPVHRRLLGDGGPAAFGARRRGARRVDGGPGRRSARDFRRARRRSAPGHYPCPLHPRARGAARRAARAAPLPRARARLPLVARRRTPRCFGGTRVAGRRDLRQGAGRAGAVRAHARRLPRLGARSPPAAAHRHPAWPRRPRRPRPRLVRGRARGLGSALRARAPDGALPSQPGRRAGRRRCLLAEVARLPPPLLREAPVAVAGSQDPRRGRRSRRWRSGRRGGRAASATRACASSSAGRRRRSSPLRPRSGSSATTSCPACPRSRW